MAQLLGALSRRSTESAPVRDLRIALEWLRARPEVESAHIGAAGFCMGGTVALALACLGWQPQVSFEELVGMMVDADVALLSGELDGLAR